VRPTSYRVQHVTDRPTTDRQAGCSQKYTVCITNTTCNVTVGYKTKYVTKWGVYTVSAGYYYAFGRYPLWRVLHDSPLLITTERWRRTSELAILHNVTTSNAESDTTSA